MTDLTEIFESAINLKESGSFHEEKWINALFSMANQNNIAILWNEEEDNWLMLGDDSKLLVMAARHIPLLFIAETNLITALSKVYGNKFIYTVINNPNLDEYCVNASKISALFPWHTDVVQESCFSLNDLFYATH
jgi:hypothetical protein